MGTGARLSEDAPRASTGSFGEEGLAFIIAIVALLLIPIRVLSAGFLPIDDALRHAGKALSTRSWQEILVLRPEITIDSHPGWHFLLRTVHLITGASAVDLLFFSVTALFLLVGVAGLLFSRYPLAWLSALAFAATFDEMFVFRFLLGRPFLVSLAALLLVLCLVDRGRFRATPSSAAIWIAVFALVAWIHPSFYLFGLVVVALAISGQRREAAFLGAVVFAGSVVAAMLTGQPLDFYEQAFLHPLFSVARPTASLVGEFQPSDGSPLFVLAAAALLWALWPAERRTLKDLLSDPILILAILGWTLGRLNLRFWRDWGEPAVLLLLSREISRHVVRILPSPRGRLGATTLVACLTGLILCNDRMGRFSAPDLTYAPMLDPARSAVLPDPGGVLYSDDMNVFYNVFMRLPNAPFKYVLGFEVGWMKPEDELVYRNGRRFGSAGFAPWANKMRPEDRLIIGGIPHTALPQLEWTPASGQLWSGRTRAVEGSQRRDPTPPPISR